MGSVSALTNQIACLEKKCNFTLMVEKLVLKSVPTIYLSYCYNLIACYPQKFGIQTLGLSVMVAMSIVTDRQPCQ